MSTKQKNANSNPAVTEPPPKPQRVNAPRVAAGPCPNSPTHTQTRIYKVEGRIRRCKCNDCGATWKLTGPYADELREYAATLADVLERTPRVNDDAAGNVILVEDTQAKEIAAKLRTLAAT